MRCVCVLDFSIRVQKRYLFICLFNTGWVTVLSQWFKAGLTCYMKPVSHRLEERDGCKNNNKEHFVSADYQSDTFHYVWWRESPVNTLMFFCFVLCVTSFVWISSKNKKRRNKSMNENVWRRSNSVKEVRRFQLFYNQRYNGGALHISL